MIYACIVNSAFSASTVVITMVDFTLRFVIAKVTINENVSIFCSIFLFPLSTNTMQITLRKSIPLSYFKDIPNVSIVIQIDDLNSNMLLSSKKQVKLSFPPSPLYRNVECESHI